MRFRLALLLPAFAAGAACPADEGEDVEVPVGVEDIGDWPMDCALGPPPFEPAEPTLRGLNDPSVWSVGGWQTTDGGDTWFNRYDIHRAPGDALMETLADGTPALAALGLPSTRYRRDGDTLWWFTADGVLRWSEDGGRSFMPVLPPLDPRYGADPRLADPTFDVRGDRLLVWTREGDDLLYSRDRGQTWRRLVQTFDPNVPMVVRQALLGPDGTVLVYKGATPSDHRLAITRDHGDSFAPVFEEPATAPLRLVRDGEDAVWALHWGDLANGGQLLLRTDDWGASWQGGALSVPGPLGAANPFIAWEGVGADGGGLLFRARMNTEAAAMAGALPPWGGHLACQVRPEGAHRLPELLQGRRAPSPGEALVVGRFHEAQAGIRDGVRVDDLWWTDPIGAALYRDQGLWFVHPTGYGPIVDLRAQPGQEGFYLLLNPTELLPPPVDMGPRAVHVSGAGELREERQIGSFMGDDGRRFREWGRALEPTRSEGSDGPVWPMMWLDSGLYPVVSDPAWGGVLDGYQGPLAIHPGTGGVLHEVEGRLELTNLTEPPCEGALNTPWCHPLPPEGLSEYVISEAGDVYAWGHARVWRRALAETGPDWELVVDGLWAPTGLVVEEREPAPRLWIADHGSLVAADLSGPLPVIRRWGTP